MFDDVAPSELDVEAVSPDGEESLLLVPVFPDEAVSDLLLSDVGSPASEVRGFPSWAELLSPELPPFTASMALSFLLLSSPPFFAAEKALAAPAISIPAAFKAVAAPINAPPVIAIAAIAAPPPNMPAPPLPNPPAREPTIGGILFTKYNKTITQSSITTKSKKINVDTLSSITLIKVFPIPTIMIIDSI
ncbi:hypothetical protein PPO65_03940 [Neisseria gonorrhoeae]